MIVGRFSYQRCFKYAVESFSVCSFDSIFEPGEVALVEKIKVANRGGMPGPANLVHIIIPQNNCFKQISVPVYLQQELEGSLQLNGSLEFKINEWFHVGVDTTWHTEKRLIVTGIHMRINKEIVPCVRTILLRYPFEMSQVWVQKAVALGEQALFAIKYRNVSSIDLGANS